MVVLVLLLALRKRGVGGTDIAKELGIARSTVYKILKAEGRNQAGEVG
ncbi:MAG: helix-turn-helix domain-containing protein [Thiothrix litoralis]